jgi:hypothetical protein
MRHPKARATPSQKEGLHTGDGPTVGSFERRGRLEHLGGSRAYVVSFVEHHSMPLNIQQPSFVPLALALGGVVLPTAERKTQVNSTNKSSIAVKKSWSSLSAAVDTPRVGRHNDATEPCSC